MKIVTPGRQYETDDGQSIAFRLSGLSGATTEDLLAIVADRLHFLQHGPSGVPDIFTAQALQDIQRARFRLINRAQMREQKGITGTSEPTFQLPPAAGSK